MLIIWFPLQIWPQINFENYFPLSDLLLIPPCLVRQYTYGKKKGKNNQYRKPYVAPSNVPTFHLSNSYRPAVPTPHSLMEDQAAMEVYNTVTTESATAIP